MFVPHSLSRKLSIAILAVATASSQVHAQAAKAFEPQVGQQGKDVVWVPTAQALVDRMLDMAKATPADYVIDLGSGDGRTVITAAKRGIKAHGIEYNPDMVELAKRNAAQAGMTERATFAKADIFESDFSQATVLTLFLLPSLNVRLRPTILNMKPGTRVVANSFDMGDWEPDQTSEASGQGDCTSYCRALLWIVPAKVEGTWKVGGSTLEIKQTYQKFSGSLKTGNVVAPITDGKMAGDQITFTAGGTSYTGKVNGNAIEGVTKAGATEAKWQAARG